MHSDDTMDQSTFRRQLRTGVTGHNRSRAEQGFILFSPLAMLNVTYAINMEGEVVHEWRHDCAVGLYGNLLENGNLFMGCKMRDSSWDIFRIWPAFKGGEIREVTPDGEVVWRHVDQFHHHDQRRMDHGGCLYLSLEEIPGDLSSQIFGGHPPPDQKGMYSDVIVEVDRHGNTLWEWHAIDHLNPETDWLPESEPRWEWTHGNTIAPIGDDRVLVSFRAIHTIGIIEKSSGRFLWKYRNPMMGGQHDPQMLPNGNILLFDNGTQRRAMGTLPYSRVIEINPGTNQVEWQYEDAPPYAFYSQQVSGAQRLPGGNTLICEGVRGRLFQVTPEGEVVWEYVSPFFGPNPFDFEINMVFRAFHYKPEQLPFVQ